MSKQSPGPLHLVPDALIASRGFDRLDHLAEAIAKPGGATASDPASRDIEVRRHKVNSILGNFDRRILIFMDDIDRVQPSSTHRTTQRTRCRSICSSNSSSPANC
ncbi:MAG: hypothetical protein ABI614_06820 [Planctomycetota bacterium]